MAREWRFYQPERQPFFDAARRGDLPAVLRHLELPDVRENVAIWNAMHRDERLRVRTRWEFQGYLPRAWYVGTLPHELMFEAIVGGAQVELFRWFFAREQLARFGEALRATTWSTARCCILGEDYGASREMVDILVKSPLFLDVMEDEERLVVFGGMLNMAVSRGYHWWIRVLLSYGADPNRVSNRETPLLAIAYQGNNETLDLLLAHGAWMEGEHLLSQRTYKWNEEVFGELLRRGADANVSHDDCGSPLHQAAWKCLAETVRHLVDEGFADVDVRDSRGCTPLMVIYDGDRSSTQLQIIQLLLSRGASIHAVDRQGRGVVHHAVCRSNDELLRAYLERGADPNLRDVNGQTPIVTLLTENELAVAGAKAQMLRVLLCAGADPFLLDNNGMSCVDVLASTETGRAFLKENPVFFRQHGK